MPRPIRDRRIQTVPAYDIFHPAAACPLQALSDVVLSLDEFEALRLADYEGLYQEAAALRMGISRQTFGRIIESARKKVADALVNGKVLRVGGGNTILQNEDGQNMIIAVPTDASGFIFPHFGHCELFAIYTVEGLNITAEQSFALPGLGGCKSGVASELAKKKVEVLIAQNIGEGAIRQLSSFGIRVIRGLSGSARAAVEAVLAQENL
ncbi:DUF134 domain-containing protein [Gracilinema caldarium]|uniref:DUF134 domain-containing protein n=1 Tax=Gracilinema caldarium TaxID=215591 RepID=UPI0026F0D0BF|nr:DUF134 domain-containing protein [Gracilinema caldarium]